MAGPSSARPLGLDIVSGATRTPEPATYGTMESFLVGGVWVARRRKAQKAANA